MNKRFSYPVLFASPPSREEKNTGKIVFPRDRQIVVVVTSLDRCHVEKIRFVE
ncbi:hypothetical protein AVEN_194679-1, partial [Araneus ventricosus]